MSQSFDSAVTASGSRLKRRVRVIGMLALSLVACHAMADKPSQEAMDAGRQLFHKAIPACALCHTLAHADAIGAIGPVLDELKPDATRVETAIRNGIGQMPAYSTLSDDEIRTLSNYVAHASAGS